MARRKMRSQTQQLLVGALTLTLAVLLLTAMGFLIQDAAQSVLPPVQTTRPPEPTLVPNPYDFTDFALEEGFMTCLSGVARPGIDVSTHQGQIDWPQVRAAGMEFAMVRIGYRGYNNGELKQDDRAQENLLGAAAVGMDVGVYFFSQAISVEEARQEAQFVLQLLGETRLQLPVTFDWEYISDTARTANVDSATLNACAQAFCAEIAQGGYRPMVYFNPDMAANMLQLVPLQQLGYPFWLAHYTDTMEFPHRVDFWQYSDQGSVPGITGKVDLNLQFIYTD